MYAVVSHPGRVEAPILSELSPLFAVHRRPVLRLTLRFLETPEADPKRAREGESPPVVLLHGRGHAATMWLPVLPELARRGRVLALDLPGFGHSSSPPFASGSAEDGLRFFVEPVEALLLEKDLRGAVLIGHSLGGLVAVELALRGAIQPSKLILIGGMGLGPEMTYLSRAFFLAGPERVARLSGPRLFSRISPYPDTPLGRRLGSLDHELCAVRGGRSAPSDAFNALFPRVGPAFNRLERLAEIRCPSLLLWGEKDAVFPPSVAACAAAAMRDATLQIEPLGHSPHLEDPARILPSLLKFLG